MYPSSPGPASAPQGYRPAAAPQHSSAPISRTYVDPTATQMGPAAAPRAPEGNLATSMLKILRPGRTPDVPAGGIKIGRATDNDIVIPDVLASRHHATLVPSAGGSQIVDNRSINGTFVNGQRVESSVLHDGDVVTIGNIDLVFGGGTLARRNEADVATRTGGLDVYGVTWTIEGNKTLLDNISLTARPGTLTAIIGPSGAGKSTFARLVAGYTHPTSGQVAFEGHDVHAEYASLRSRIGMVPQDDVVHGELTVRQALMYAAELRLAPRHQQGRPRTGRQRGARRTRDDQTPRHARRQALGRPAQTRLRRARAAHRAVVADPRRTHLGSGSRAGPPGDDDAAPAGRRGPRRAGRDSLADLSGRLRSGPSAGPGWQDRVLRFAQPDRCGTRNHQLGRHLQHGRQRSRGRQAPLPRAPRPTAAAACHPGSRRISDRRRVPACPNSSRRLLAARCG